MKRLHLANLKSDLDSEKGELIEEAEFPMVQEKDTEADHPKEREWALKMDGVLSTLVEEKMAIRERQLPFKWSE